MISAKVQVSLRAKSWTELDDLVREIREKASAIHQDVRSMPTMEVQATEYPLG